MTSDTALLYRNPGVKLVTDPSLFSPPNLFAFLLVVSTASLVLYLTYILHTLVGTTQYPAILTLTLNEQAHLVITAILQKKIKIKQP